MKRSMRFLCLLMSISLIVGLTACGGGATSSSSANIESNTPASSDGGSATSPTVDTSKHEEINMMFFCSEPPDLQNVFDELNKIVGSELNITVKPIITNLGNYQQQQNLMLSSNEKVDVAIVLSTAYPALYSKGQIIPLDDLLSNYGQGIVDAVGMDFIDGGRVGKDLYGLVINRDLAATYGFTMNKELCDKYGIEPSEITNLEQMGKALAVIKENESTLLPLVTNPRPHDTSLLGVDPLSDSFGVLMNYGEKPEVVNFFATQEYKDYVYLMREWFQKGYISEDDATKTENYVPTMQAKKAFGFLTNQKPGYDEQETLRLGYEVVSSSTVDPICTTSAIQTILWTIPRNCANPERAMQFLNMVYTNEDIMNLLAWGIEGTHYVKNSDGSIGFPEGVDASNSGYNLNAGWMFGNQFITHVWEGNPLDLYEQMDAFNRSARKSAAFGFTYDPESVKTEVSAATNVSDQYRKMLCYGLLDPDTALPEFLSKLEAAGIDKIIAEKQRQLDEFLANK